jgi:hypothetical protein
MPVASPAISHMDAETLRQRLQTLKEEMESIRLASVDYLKFKAHTKLARMAHQSRMIHLEAIISELVTMTKKKAMDR